MSESKQEEILESTVDAAEWNLEVERVLPQLKVTIRTDNKVGNLANIFVCVRFLHSSLFFVFVF